MPVAIEKEQCEAFYSKMSPKLTHLLERRSVPYEVICALGRDDITTVGIFARTGRGNEDRFVTWLERDIGVLETDPGGRSLQARVLDAWDAAKQQKTETDAVEAKTRAAGLTPSLLTAEQIELRKAYAELVGDLDDDKYPSYFYINMRLEEIEEGELVSDTLDMVTSRTQEKRNGPKDYTMEWTKTGEAVMRKSKLKGSLPTSTEEYRALYQLRRHQWGVVRLRHGNKPYLGNLNADWWYEHVEYMLGEKVRGYCAKSPTGEVLASLSWATFLTFDQAVMDSAFKEVNLKGTSLATAIASARTDNELRTQYLVTQLAINNQMSSASSSRGPRGPPAPQEYTGNEGKGAGGGGKGRGKGGGKRNDQSAKGKGKVKAKSKEKAGHSSKLNMARKFGVVKAGAGGACFNFNKAGGCAKGDACEFPHVCVFCEGNHSIEHCKAFANWCKE